MMVQVLWSYNGKAKAVFALHIRLLDRYICILICYNLYLPKELQFSGYALYVLRITRKRLTTMFMDEQNIMILSVAV